MKRLEIQRWGQKEYCDQNHVQKKIPRRGYSLACRVPPKTCGAILPFREIDSQPKTSIIFVCLFILLKIFELKSLMHLIFIVTKKKRELECSITLPHLTSKACYQYQLIFILIMCSFVWFDVCARSSVCLMMIKKKRGKKQLERIGKEGKR